MPRAAQYIFEDEYFGIVTQDYAVDKHMLYYTSTEGIDKGLELRYVVYYPTFEGADKSVLVNIHGSSCDKDIGNYAYRNKYFASRGYVVYDIQIGYYKERDIQIQLTPEIRNSGLILVHINEFLKYAVNNNDKVKANLQYFYYRRFNGRQFGK